MNRGVKVGDLWICGSPQHEGFYTCSLPQHHLGDHKAYAGHDTTREDRYRMSWERTVTDDEVAQAIDSIKMTANKTH